MEVFTSISIPLQYFKDAGYEDYRDDPRFDDLYAYVEELFPDVDLYMYTHVE